MEEIKPKSIFIRLSPTLHTLLSHRAQANQRSLNIEVNMLIRDALGVNGTSYGYKEGSAITGEDLVQWRKSKALSQRALSALMNVPAQGEKNPSYRKPFSSKYFQLPCFIPPW